MVLSPPVLMSVRGFGLSLCGRGCVGELVGACATQLALTMLVDADTTGPVLTSVTCEQSKAGVFAIDVVVQGGEPVAALKCIIRVTTESSPTLASVLTSPTLASVLTIGIDAVHVSAGAYTVASSPEDTTTEFRAFCVASDALSNWSPSVASSPVFTYLSAWLWLCTACTPWFGLTVWVWVSLLVCRSFQ